VQPDIAFVDINDLLPYSGRYITGREFTDHHQKRISFMIAVSGAAGIPLSYPVGLTILLTDEFPFIYIRAEI
jgi:hypothetical protein